VCVYQLQIPRKIFLHVSFFSLSPLVLLNQNNKFGGTVVFFLPGPPSLNVSLQRKREKKGEINQISKVHFRFLFFDSRSEILKDGAKNIYVE